MVCGEGHILNQTLSGVESLQVRFPAACDVGRSKIGSLEMRRSYPAPWGGELDCPTGVTVWEYDLDPMKDV